jgi:hypothetical protein
MKYEFLNMEFTHCVFELHKAQPHAVINDVKIAEKYKICVIKTNSPLKKKDESDIIP